MPVAVTDVLFMKSSTGASDGGAESPTELVSGTANALWPNISDALRAAGGTRYKKFYIRNDHATDLMVKPTVWIAESPPGVTVSLGLGAASADDATSTLGTLTAWSANAVVALVSSGTDSRTATIFGLNASSVPVSEAVALTGTGEVLSSNTYSKVWCVYMSATNGSNTVTIKQGSGGTTRGTIAPTFLICWLWVAAISKATGITVPDLTAGLSIPLWCRQVWSPGISAVRPTRQVVSVEESP
jgi:hypothetical protein